MICTDSKLSTLIKSQKNMEQPNNKHCVTDGKKITLTSTMKIGQFAGPPNFESVKDGDKLFNQKASVTAMPFTAHTDYHQTPLVLDVKHLEKED